MDANKYQVKAARTLIDRPDFEIPDNDIMLVRICMKEWPMFPTSAISVKMPTDSNDGSVSMVVTSVFVNEPG